MKKRKEEEDGVCVIFFLKAFFNLFDILLLNIFLDYYFRVYRKLGSSVIVKICFNWNGILGRVEIILCFFMIF